MSSFLRRLFGRKKPPPEPSVAIVMVMLPAAASFDGSAVLEHLAAHWSDLPSILDRETQEAITAATIPGGTIALMHLPMPVPQGDLDGPIARAWHWSEARDAIATHRSHVIVHASSTVLDRVTVGLLLTKLAASVLAVGNGIGVYVGDAGLVRSAADYLADAEGATPDALPLLSWIGFNLVREDDQTLSAYTTGLGAFGVMELETRHTALSPADVLGTLADIANYQLTSGAVLKDGDTFGESEVDRRSVRHAPSAFIADTTVALLELSAPR